MLSPLATILEGALTEADGLEVDAYASWRRRLTGALQHLNPELEAELVDLDKKYPLYSSWYAKLEHQSALLRAVLLDQAWRSSLESRVHAPSEKSGAQPASRTGTRVFVVHGRNNEAKEAIARHVTNLGLEPVILHEQPSGSKAVLEKLETYSGVAFAIVCLTADDFGGLAPQDGTNKPQPRARQNVIFELGYFIALLGRSRVCALYAPGVELPSDFVGIVYIEYDERGAWRTKIAQELVHAGLNIRLEALLKS